MNCEKCGNTLNENEKICKNCGAVNMKNTYVQEMLKPMNQFNTFNTTNNISNNNNNNNNINMNMNETINLKKETNSTLIIFLIACLLSLITYFINPNNKYLISTIITVFISVFLLGGTIMFYKKLTGKIWPFFIPIYNTYLIYDSVFEEKALLYFILTFVPIVNFIIVILLLIKIAQNFNASIVIMLLFGSIYIPLIGLSNKY